MTPQFDNLSGNDFSSQLANLMALRGMGGQGMPGQGMGGGPFRAPVGPYQPQGGLPMPFNPGLPMSPVARPYMQGPYAMPQPQPISPAPSPFQPFGGLNNLQALSQMRRPVMGGMR